MRRLFNQNFFIFFIILFVVIAIYAIERYWLSEKHEDADPETGGAVRNLHLAAHWVPAQLGVVSLQWTASRSTGQQGQALRLGLERVTPRYHLSARVETADSGVRQWAATVVDWPMTATTTSSRPAPAGEGASTTRSPPN